MIDHITIRVADLERARSFYGRALELLAGPAPSEGGGFIEFHDRPDQAGPPG
jgi:catechol 2,3-dioxygenase-like lactoylglutathione lyase family enzyme